jgi:hypothetical protein
MHSDSDRRCSSQGAPARFYHGTSLCAILDIQNNGFDVKMSGTNAGASLGPGVYVTASLEKALNYAKCNPGEGGVLILEVDLGRCYRVRSNEQTERTAWASLGYDSAWAAVGVIGKREENCVRDPARIRLTDVALGNTSKAHSLGYEVRNGRLELCVAVERERYKLLLQQAKAAEAKAKASEKQSIEEVELLRRERDELVRLNDEILQSAPAAPSLQNALQERKWIVLTGLILIVTHVLVTHAKYGSATATELATFSAVLGVVLVVHCVLYMSMGNIMRLTVALKLLFVGAGLWAFTLLTSTAWSTIVDTANLIQGDDILDLCCTAAKGLIILFVCVQWSYMIGLALWRRYEEEFYTVYTWTASRSSER